MTEAGTLCSNGDVLKKCGANVSSTYSAEAYTNVYIKEAEAFISTQCRYDFVTNYTSVSTIGKEILRDVVSSLAAIDVINMNAVLSSYDQVMIDVLWSKVVEVVNLLREQNYRNFVISGTVA